MASFCIRFLRCVDLTAAPATPSTTRTIHSATTVFVQGATSTGAVTASTSSGSGGGGGLAVADKIALGIGIGFGIPTLIIGIVQIIRMSHGHSFLGNLR